MERFRRTHNRRPAGRVVAIVAMLWAGSTWLSAQPLVPSAGESLGGRSPQQTTSDLVTASSPSVTDTPFGSHEVAFIVTNNSDWAVTAWEVAVECRYTDGTTRARSVARDSFRSYEGLTPGAETAETFLVRHGTSIGRIVFPAKAGESLVVTRIALQWAVFADGSGIGDPAGRAGLFRDREQVYQKWVAVLAALRAAQASASGSASLTDALQRIDALKGEAQEGIGELVTIQMRRNLEMAISRKVPPDEFLAKWIARAERELKSADSHRRSR